MLRKHVRKALCLPALAAAAVLMLTGCGNPEAKEAFEAAAAALDEGRISEDLERSAKELSFILESFEADEVSDIQPMDVDEAEAAPDPAIFDVLNFVVRDLEDAGGITCPCGKGPYEVRFTDDGAEAVCSTCGASYRFYARSAASAESYLSLDSITLS